MKYALFEAIQEKSTSKALQDFRPAAQSILSKYGRHEQPYPYTILCCLSSDTSLFGDLLYEANYARVAYRVHYFQDDPVVFDSHPSSAPHK